MEFSKWARKLVRELEDCDFEMQKAKGTSHRQFKYIGSEMDFPDIVTVPVKIKGTSQIRSIATINKKLKKYNAPQSMIDRFKNIAMGLLTVEEGDDIEAVEEKLYDALNNNNIIAVSELSAYLQELAFKNNLMPYESQSLKKFKNEKILMEQKYFYIRAINNHLLKIFKTAVNIYIEENGYIEAGSIYAFHPPESFTFDNCKASDFGLSIQQLRQNDWDNHFTVYGSFRSPLLDILQKSDNIGFSVVLNNDDGEKYAIYYDNESFYSFNAQLHYYSIEQLKEVMDRLSKHMTMFLLKYNPN